MTQEERDNLLLDLKDGQKRLEDRFCGVEGRIDGIDKRIDGLENKFNGLEERQTNLEKTQLEMQKELRNISQTVARIEVEHGEKLAILFDAVTVNSEKIDSINNKFDSLDKRQFNSENAIFALNQKVKAF